MSLYRRLSFLGVLALVLLRVCVGWHFFMEGTTKVKSGDFSSAGFLGAAQGPLRDQFRSLIPDTDGWSRLDSETMSGLLAKYIERASKKYRFNEDQQAEAAEILSRHQRLIDGVYDQWNTDIKEYKLGYQRLNDMKSDAKWNNVASLHGQQTDIENKWRTLVKPALASIDNVIHSLERQVYDLGSAGQRRRGMVPFAFPNESALGSRTVDKIIPIFDMVVGILLIIGLFTPVAGLAGGVFLLSVVLSQFPGFPDTQPTYYQAIEAIACLTLAATHSGRYAGLDFLGWVYWNTKRAKSTSLKPA